LVSRLSARATGVFHATEKRARPKVTIQTAGLIKRLTKLEEEKTRWRDLVGDRLPMMRVSYEDFVRDGQACGRDMLQFIGVTPQPLGSQLSKLNPDQLREIVENYEEVARHLAATPFARYLTDRL
jgi:LPS sulfotransferase NodH